MLPYLHWVYYLSLCVWHFGVCKRCNELKTSNCINLHTKADVYYSAKFCEQCKNKRKKERAQSNDEVKWLNALVKIKVVRIYQFELYYFEYNFLVIDNMRFNYMAIVSVCLCFSFLAYHAFIKHCTVIYYNGSPHEKAYKSAWILLRFHWIRAPYHLIVATLFSFPSFSNTIPFFLVPESLCVVFFFHSVVNDQTLDIFCCCYCWFFFYYCNRHRELVFIRYVEKLKRATGKKTAHNKENN